MKGLDPNVTRQSLLSRLRQWDDQESWQVFFERYWKLIYSTAIRAGLSHPDAEDIVQETMFSVAKNMPGFKYNGERGSFRSWLLRVTYRRITDHTRKRTTECLSLPDNTTGAADVQTAPSICPVDPGFESMWNEEWESNIVHAAMSITKRRVDSKAYQIYDLHVIKGWPVSRVTGSMKVSRARVYLAKHRVGKVLQEVIASLRDKPI